MDRLPHDLPSLDKGVCIRGLTFLSPSWANTLSYAGA